MSGSRPVFERVLVANRGEIAVRILRTLETMGIGTVAVFSEADGGAPHVAMADVAVALGAGPARDNYLSVDKLVSAALDHGAEAVHPGYGFLSENEDLATALESVGIAFIGPTPEQLRIFGAKHLARDAATAAGVPLLAGSGLLGSADEALAVAASIGFPVMLKAVAGGGGIGMSVCRDADELREAFERVRRLAEANFGSSGVFVEKFIERARHVEVQVFGNGVGGVVTLGERDCSMQRRNQKVVEESPAFGLPDETRRRLADTARNLAESVSYRSAGTVEFLVDADTFEPAFLEVNARLQVEHPVTEAVWGVDLVEWMVRVAAGEKEFLDDWIAEAREPVGHAIEVRLYAEDPGRDHRPSPGLLTEVRFGPEPAPDPAGPYGEGIRVDTWVSTGTELSPLYDPLMAKIIAHGADRTEAADRLAAVLAASRFGGVQTNLDQLRSIIDSAAFRDTPPTTGVLATLETPDPTFEVVAPGTMTTVQDHPGRVGTWHVGVPPSGPMDDRSFRLGNIALGNEPGCPGLELTVTGPTLRFASATTVMLTGAEMAATLETRDGSISPVRFWEPVEVSAGSTLAIGTAGGAGLRSYLLVRGGIDVPRYLGSASTFTLGGFGGHGGRALRTGDVLRLGHDVSPAAAPVPPEVRPALVNDWEVGVLIGPHAAPEFFTESDIESFFASRWTVHHNSSRTGVRLVGPRPEWARIDGGEAGLHPSNIHDTPYAVGAVDFTGDMPIILGPDGPSLGGFVCPVVVCEAERWKIGQFRPGDTVSFVPIDATAAVELRSDRDRVEAGSAPAFHALRRVSLDGEDGVLARRESDGRLPELTLRRAGDEYLLIEYGPMLLDLEVRLRVHTLMEWVHSSGLPGVIDVCPGIRSLQLHLDPSVMSVEQAAKLVIAAQDELPSTDEIEVPSRIVHLPLSWDDPSTREAIERYMTSVRSDAPWCPWNIEFIRRINGLDSVEEVRRTVFDASYLVLGLGDVYLGAPVATPLDPRHRLVTTKYNPARTWTPQNAVGIGGAYMCIYGMEGPGGYQFVGRTVQIWNTFRDTAQFRGDTRWLLRFFDQIRWYPVETEELADMRDRMEHGRLEIEMEDTRFNLAEYQSFLAAESDSIEEFRTRQQTAFRAEREAWAAAGEFDRVEAEPAAGAATLSGAFEAPEGSAAVTSPMAANVWQVLVGEGDVVEVGDPVVVLEAMKMETWVHSDVAGTVTAVLAEPGSLVHGGAPLVLVELAT